MTPKRCIKLALICCFFAATVSGNNSANNSTGSSAFPENERPCCKNMDVLNYKDMCVNQLTNETYDSRIPNCSRIYHPIKGFNHYVVNSEGVLMDRHFNYEADYCLGIWNGMQMYHSCVNDDADASRIAFFFSKGIMMLISVLFLIATRYVYFLIPNRQERHDQVIQIAVTYLMMFMLFLGFVQVNAFKTYHCHSMVLGLLLYFSMISYFAWSNIVMASVWKSTVARRWEIKQKTWHIVCHVYALTVALTWTGRVYYHHKKDATFDEISWWFKKRNLHRYEASYFAYVPTSVMLSLSTLLLVWIIYYLFFSEKDTGSDRKNPLRFKCILGLKLFLLSGLTWTFEILSFYVFRGSYNRSWFWLPIDAINCLHGVLIFFVLVVCRPGIKRELSGRTILCFRCPTSWAQLYNEEQEQVVEREDANREEQAL